MLSLPASGTWVLVTMLVASVAAVRGIWSPCGLSMVSSINPFTERSRGHRYGATASWFVAGSLLGGVMLGAAGAAGAALVSLLALPPALIAVVAAGCCLVALASDSAIVVLRLPLIPRQVNERWLDGYRRWVYAVGFGWQIGVGLATYVMTGAVYLVPVLGALSGAPLLALAAGAAFGLVRGGAILLSSRARDPEQLRSLHRRLAQLAPWSLRWAMTVSAGGAVAFGWVAGGLLLAVGVVAALLAAVLLLRSRANARTGSTSELRHIPERAAV